MIIFILFVVIVVVVIIYNNFDNFSSLEGRIDEDKDLENKLYNGDKLNGYRLADIIFYPDYLKFNHQYSTRDHLYRFPGTIGTTYVKRKYPQLNKINKPDDFEIYKKEYLEFEDLVDRKLYDIKIDTELLNEIIEQKGFEQPQFTQSTLLLHVRVGDVLCGDYKNGEAPSNYAKVGDNDWWNKVMDYIIKNKITKIIILSGTHFKECLEESVHYLQFVKKRLEGAGLHVSYHIGNSPDEDLAYSKNAKHFITTGGGYGFFLGKIIELNGGNFVLHKQNTSVRADRKLF